MSVHSSYSLGPVVFSHLEIEQAVMQYAQKINKLYHGKKLVVIGILNGAVFFVVKFLQHLQIDIELDFLAVSSYQSQSKKEKIKFYKEIKLDLRDKNILVLEDIIDSGSTCRLVGEFIQTFAPRSLRFCSLISLQSAQNRSTNYDFLFQTTPRWLVGFGLDINEQYRHLPDIHELILGKPS